MSGAVKLLLRLPFLPSATLCPYSRRSLVIKPPSLSLPLTCSIILCGLVVVVVMARGHRVRPPLMLFKVKMVVEVKASLGLVVGASPPPPGSIL